MVSAVFISKTIPPRDRFVGENLAPRTNPLHTGRPVRDIRPVSEFERIREIASTQHGLLTRLQAREVGFTRKMLQNRVRSGYLTFVTPRVLRIGGSAVSRWQTVMAGVLDVGPAALASHLTAAAMWGVPNVPIEPVDVSVERYVRRNRAPVRVHHLTVIPSDQRAIVYDIPVTAPAFTVLCVTGSHGTRRGAQVLDHLLGQGDVTVDEVWEVVDGLSKQGRNGLRDLRKLLDDRAEHQPPAESNNERRFDYLARRAGIVTLRRQVNISAPSWVGRVDFEDTALPFVVEIQSERYHTSWAARRADAERIRRLEGAGYTVLVVWDHELWFDGDAVVDRLLNARQHLLRQRS